MWSISFYKWFSFPSRPQRSIQSPSWTSMQRDELPISGSLGWITTTTERKNSRSLPFLSFTQSQHYTVPSARVSIVQHYTHKSHRGIYVHSSQALHPKCGNRWQPTRHTGYLFFFFLLWHFWTVNEDMEDRRRAVTHFISRLCSFTQSMCRWWRLARWGTCRSCVTVIMVTPLLQWAMILALDCCLQFICV